LDLAKLPENERGEGGLAYYYLVIANNPGSFEAKQAMLFVDLVETAKAEWARSFLAEVASCEANYTLERREKMHAERIKRRDGTVLSPEKSRAELRAENEARLKRAERDARLK